MTRWSDSELTEYMLQFKKPESDDQEADLGPESILQAKIVKWAKGKGYPCLSLKQSKKARGYIIPGWPDITLALPGGRTVWIELKAKKGVLKEDQKLIALMLLKLGHEWYVLRSFRKFLEII